MEESIEEEIERRTPDRQSVQARTSCNCKSTCSRKRVEDGARARGCPCKGANKHCNSSCKCGTRSKPCQNKQLVGNDLVKKYFHLGFEYKEMLALLYVHHGETLRMILFRYTTSGWFPLCELLH
ncbi:predicted protein [Nematostella vectensis]|uniref:Uncharacterized protein n=1 Tax=Nematostella vectensis TaxID=45351 RepID=A7T9I1_NEMVE|nr:predicted protein [Nematostella vectensis]|eukprot:XP_001619444.1 hypothetical protein NEMVEDRAFT_v1g248854 [Nematostella vectensis]